MTPWPNYEVIFYRDTAGRSPVEEFMNSLLPRVRAKFLKWTLLLEEKGPDLPRPYADILQGKIRELRLKFGSDQYRFLYFFCGKKIVLTHGFAKKTDRVPEEEIERAGRMMNDFLFRLKGGEVEI